MDCKAYLLLVVTHLQLIFGLSPFVQYKCWLWDSPCLTANTQAVVKALAAGIPELGTEQLDTMYVDNIDFDQDGIKAVWTDVYFEGLKNTTIETVSIDSNTNSTTKSLRLVFHTDLSVQTHYRAEGFLFNLPFVGAGQLTAQFRYTKMEFHIPFRFSKDISGNDIIDLQSYEYQYEVKDGATLNFEHLYYGRNKKLSQKMHKLLDENWKPIVTKYGRVVFDKMNDKIFTAARTYLYSRPLESVPVL